MMFLPTIRNATRDRTGLAAVEFAMIAPLLAFVALALADAANLAIATDSMQRAERAGIQYFMNGGTDTTAAKTIVTSAWTNPPSGYTLNASKVCKCANNGQTVTCPVSGSSGSSGNCSDGQTPIANMTITATATVGGLLMSHTESQTETLRVQ
jgi:Flp pilus assembly protein TadG